MGREDHIKVSRSGYDHHGIDCGDGTVIHFSGEPGSKSIASEIQRTSMLEFLDGGKAVILSKCGENAVLRAESELGKCGYSLILNNCEHFGA